MSPEAFIVAGVRTPIGSLGGSLSTVPATELGATCVKAVLEHAKVSSEEVNEIIMGNVVGAGLGQNPARQAAIKGGLPVSVGAFPSRFSYGITKETVLSARKPRSCIIAFAGVLFPR